MEDTHDLFCYQVMEELAYVHYLVSIVRILSRENKILVTNLQNYE
jgi:hypothetical protein